MPTRILRDWTDSEPIESISWQDEVFFTRLIMKVDDFGRFSANPKLLNSLIFPLKTGIRDSDIFRILSNLQRADLIAVYEVEGKNYLQIKKFGNKPRAKESKYPAFASNMKANVCNLQTNACLTVTETETETVSSSSAHADGRLALEDFDSFWTAYPRKVGKADAKKAWIKTAKERPELSAVLRAIRKQCNSTEWQKDRGAFIPHPSTWLNQGRWDDGGLDMDALRGKTNAGRQNEAAITIPEVDENAALAWLRSTYDQIEHIPVENYSKPFSLWPEIPRAEYLKTLSRP